MIKKAFALLAVLALLLTFAASAGAETAGERFTIPDTAFSFVVPEDAVFVHPNLPASDPAWAAANILDVNETQTQFLEDGMAGEIYLANGRVIGVSVKRSQTFSEYVFNLSDASDDMKAQVLERLSPSNESETSGGTAAWVDHPQTPFFCLDIFSKPSSLDSEEEPQTVYERLYGTIVNGDLIAFDLSPTEEKVSDELDGVLRGLVASVQVSEFQPRPTFELSPASVALLAVIGGIILLIVASIVWNVHAKRRDKREKAELGTRLLQYRRSKEGHEDEGDGELRFRNETEFTDSAVKIFSKYHAVRHGMFMPVFTIVVALAALFVLRFTTADDSWWMAILLVGFIIYFAYHIWYAPTALFKTLSRVYGKFKNRKNTYYFYDGDFRISGMQSSSLHPYFQITQFVEHGAYFYLYMGVDNAYYIEKDAFSLGDADSFRAFMKEKLGPKAKLRGVSEGSVKA